MLQAPRQEADCREGGPNQFYSFQKRSRLYCRCLHANAGRPISARTDAFDIVRQLARKIALAPNAGVFELAGSLPGCRNPRRVQCTPVPAELHLCRDALNKSVAFTAISQSFRHVYFVAHSANKVVDAGSPT